MFRFNFNTKGADKFLIEIIKNNDELILDERKIDAQGNDSVYIKNDYICIGDSNKLKRIFNARNKEVLIDKVSNVFGCGSRYTIIEIKRGYVLFDNWHINKYIEPNGNIRDEYKFLDEEKLTNNKANEITVKLNLDTTEFAEKLNRIEKKLEKINYLEAARRLSKTALKSAEAALEFEESLNKVKEMLDK